MEQKQNANLPSTAMRSLHGEGKKLKKTYILRRLWRYFKEYKWLLSLAIFLTLAGNALALVGPKLSGLAIDAVEPGPGKVDFATVFYYAKYMALFYALSASMSYALARLMIRLSRNIVYRMRRDIFEKLVSLPVGFFDRHQTGDVISIISYDVDTINASLSNDIVQICTSFITVLGSLAMMLSISPVLILVFVVTIPVSVLITRYRAKKVRPLFRLRSKKLGELNGFVEEVTSGQRTTKAYHREQVMIDRFDVKNKEAVDAYCNADYYACVMGPSVNFVNNFSLALISVFGGLLYMSGGVQIGGLAIAGMTIGGISSFIMYSRKFAGPINEIANIFGELQSALAAADRVFSLLDAPLESADAPDAVTLADVRGDVEMKDVSFGYEPGRLILKHLNLRARSGNLIAIVGPTGAGKTTLINLLMRFYDINDGQITVDDHDIRHITRKSLRGAYSMVLQDTWLFSGTIYENIAYARPDATREEVIEAAKAAKIHHYIMSLPQGYDTVITDDGANISKGQKQLMTIARAMLVNAHMLILDEATSNVDTRTEVQIQQAMRRLMRDKTCFVVAHRLSTIKNADLILVVRGGNVVESGTHRELMAKGGFYREMYDAQFH